MPYSKFAARCPHCPHCNEIAEPVHKSRQGNSVVKATYRCEKDATHSWQQNFNVSFDAPQIEPPEPQEEEEKPPVPEGEVMQWNTDTRDEFIKHYGNEEYKKLVSKHFNKGQAYAEGSKSEPAMPTADDPRQWSDNQRDNFIDSYGREKYSERLQYAYAKDKEE